MRVGAFILLPLYTHYLTVADFGILALLNSISAIVSSFLGIGIAHATLRFYFEFDRLQDRNAVVSTALITTTVICSFAIIGLSFGSTLLSELIFKSDNYAKAINITYIALVFEMARQVGLSYMRAKEYSILFVSVSILQLLMQVCLNVYFLAVLHYGVIGVVVGNAITVLSGLIICCITVIKECGLRFEFNKMKVMLNYSYPFLFSSIISVIMQNVDRFILTSLFSLEAVGIYSLALKYSSVLQELVVEPFKRSFGAFRFSIMKQDNSKNIQSKTLKYLLFVTCWVGLGLSLFAKEAIDILATQDYTAVVKYIPLAITSLIILSSKYIFQTGILYDKSTIKMFFINFFTGVFGVICSSALIYFFGIFGACSAQIFRSAFSVFLTYKISQKIYSVEYDFKGAAYCLISAIGLYLLSRFLLSSYMFIDLFSKIILSILFPIIIYKSSFFTTYEKEFINSFTAKAMAKVFYR